MAVFPDHLPGVSVSITIDKQPLPEREMPDPDPQVRTVNCLVEAQTNKIFEIRVITEANAVFKGNALRCDMYVDGNFIDSGSIEPPGSYNTGTSKGLRVASDQVRKYMFANVQDVEKFSQSISSRSRAVRQASQSPPPSEASIGNMSQVLYTGSPTVSSSRHTEEELSELGTIKVEVFHINIGLDAAVSQARAREFNENALKARERKFEENILGTRIEAINRHIKHYVSLTEPVPETKKTMRSDYKKVPGVPTPAATFIFHYRSAEGLDSMQAAVAALPFRPRPGQPAPSEPAQIDKENALPIRKKHV